MGESGYYQSGHPGSKGGVHVMLALRMHGAFPAAFKIVRPTIGRLAQPLALSVSVLGGWGRLQAFHRLSSAGGED